MVYTTHGYHIAGTQLLGTIPESEVSGCGGPMECAECQREAITSSYEDFVAEGLKASRQFIKHSYEDSGERSHALRSLDETELWLSRCQVKVKPDEQDEEQAKEIAFFEALSETEGETPALIAAAQYRDELVKGE